MRFLLLFSLLFFINSTSVKSQKLSDEAEIYLLTCEPGEELYSLFGHSALRVKDSTQKFDYVFNYGTFDFSTPNFYLKFAMGKLNYHLSVVNYEYFLVVYQSLKRSVYSQKLLLDNSQKQELFDALLVNYEPQNREYKYDFFLDNCATRIDDIIKNSITGTWQDNTPIKNDSFSYRTGLTPYLKNSNWTNLGLNIILGAPTDRPQQGLFLPDIMKEHYSHITLNEKPIVAPVTTLYQANNSPLSTPLWKSPYTFFYLLALLLLLYSIFTPRRIRLIDFFLFFVVGIVGSIITFLWFISEHTATNENWNILWALPSHLFIAFLLLRKQISKFIYHYLRITLFINTILLIFAVFPSLFFLFNYTPKAFPFSLLIPILLCIIFRSIGIIFKNNSYPTKI